MKKTFLLFEVLGTATCLYAQSEGNVGINTVNPTAALHVKSKGNTATTQALKVDNADGTNLLTINNDGTVSGVAAVNLSSGTPSAAKGSGIFSGMSSAPQDGYVSPVGNNFSASTFTLDDPAFYKVAQTVPYNTRLDLLTFSLRTATFYYSPMPLTAELYVNGASTGLYAMFYEPFIDPGFTYTSFPSTGSISLQRGALIAFKITGFMDPNINCYVSVRYTEE